MEVDLLRCNSNFSGKPRYDAVMLNDGGNGCDFSFGRLAALFTIQDARLQEPLPLAYVELLDGKVTAKQREKDAVLGFLRVRQSSQRRHVVVFARSIVRGALLVPTFEGKDSDFFVFDVVDGDMFLRIRDTVQGF